MKIGILTQPLTNNYGGLLQAYALQTTLEHMGHEVVILNRPMPFVPDKANDKIGPRTKRFFLNSIKLLMNKPLTTIYHELLPHQWPVVNRFTQLFINRYHHKSPDFYTTLQLIDYCKQERIDAYIVGSDQCWRPLYSPCLPNYFLDFAEKWDVKRIAYAASFGVDNWELSEAETEICAPLAQKFDAISVREETGITLCKEHLGVPTIHVLDPTMLLDVEDYNALVADFDPTIFDISPEHRVTTTLDVKERKLFCYVLDKDAHKKTFMQMVSEKCNLNIVECMPKDFRAQEVFEICPDDCTFPPVELWLQSFRDADMVVADSFHGTVFSIIYNKPFLVLGNPGRGMARFHSLLKMFGLEDRLVTPDKYDSIDINAPINWDAVNARREQLKQMSLDFLKTNLQ